MTMPPKALELIGKLYTLILNPIISFLFILAFAYFIWGVVLSFFHGDKEEAREKGRSAMLWGIIGMFIMFSVFGILRIVLSTFGIDATTALRSV